MDILDKKATLKAITAIKKSDGTLRDKIQHAAIGALVHAGEHGDTGLMSKLVLAVNGNTAIQLRKYFQAFAPVHWNTGKGTFSKVKKGGAYRTSDAMGVNWFDAIEAQRAEAKTYDTMITLTSAVKTLAKLRDLAEENLDVGTAFVLDAAREALLSADNYVTEAA